MPLVWLQLLSLDFIPLFLVPWPPSTHFLAHQIRGLSFLSLVSALCGLWPHLLVAQQPLVSPLCWPTGCTWAFRTHLDSSAKVSGHCSLGTEAFEGMGWTEEWPHQPSLLLKSQTPALIVLRRQGFVMSACEDETVLFPRLKYTA